MIKILGNFLTIGTDKHKWNVILYRISVFMYPIYNVFLFKRYGYIQWAFGSSCMHCCSDTCWKVIS